MKRKINLVIYGCIAGAFAIRIFKLIKGTITPSYIKEFKTVRDGLIRAGYGDEVAEVIRECGSMSHINDEETYCHATELLEELGQFIQWRKKP